MKELINQKHFVGFSSNSYLIFFRYVLLLCSIIPISMRVNLDFAKLVYAFKINKDKEIEDSVTRNS